MGRKCCVPGCKSNYNGYPPYTTTFRFPYDQHLKNVWLRYINRDCFTPSRHSCVCINHFEEDFLERESSAMRDDGSLLTVRKSRPTLKQGAFPTIFKKELESERKKALVLSLKCRVPACQANYDKTLRVRCFSVPTDQTLREKWLQAIPKEEFATTNCSKVCERHFKEDEILRGKICLIDKTKKTNFPYKTPRLKKDAVPSIFPDVSPKTLSLLTKHRKRFKLEPAEFYKEDPTAFDPSANLELELTTGETESDCDMPLEPLVSVKEEPTSEPEDNTTYCGASTSTFSPLTNLATQFPSQSISGSSTSTTPSVINVGSLANTPAQFSSTGEILGFPVADFGTGVPPSGVSSEVGSATNGGLEKNRLLSSTDPTHNGVGDPTLVPVYRTRDRFDVFGEYIASELRRMDGKTCAHVQKAFNDILFDAQMGKFS